jgi:hypothetical protein
MRIRRPFRSGGSLGTGAGYEWLQQEVPDMNKKLEIDFDKYDHDGDNHKALGGNV